MRQLIQVILVSVVVAAAWFAALAFFALSAPQDQHAIRRHLVEAVASGKLNETARMGPFLSTELHQHVFNCMLFNMMLAPEAGRLANAMSNRYVNADPSWRDPRVPPFPDCQALLRALPEVWGADGGVTFTQYDRYILGMRVLGRAMLSYMSFDAMRRTLLAVAYGLLAAIGLIALCRLVRAGNVDERRRTAGYLAIAGCFLLFFGVHFFDASINFAPMDCTHFAFVLLSLVVPLADMRERGSMLFAASYGSLIAIFEFLTGGVPVALALLPALLALGFRGDLRSYLAKVAVLWSSFCVAVVSSFAIKVAFSIAFLGGSDPFIAPLLNRMYGGLAPATDVFDPQYSLAYVWSVYKFWIGMMAWSSRNFGIALVVVSLCTIAFMTWRLWKARGSLGNAVAACWLGLAVIVAWYLVFLNHAVLHPSYMVRLLIVPITLAAVLIAMTAASPKCQTS